MGKSKVLRKLIAKFRVSNGKRFKLSDVDPDDTGPFESDDKDASAELLAKGAEKLAALQEKLYAQDRWSLLLIFQAMDAAGKDGTIKHVMSGVNPQGCQVHSFKAPSAEELDHDFLWRTNKALPERGRIGIFNRSYYEEVLVVRVHQDFLKAQRLPPEVVTKHIWKERFADINAMERYLSRNGTVIRKFFLHVSKDEQKRRFLDRLNDPTKNWKFSMKDVQERDHWNGYMRAYEEMIQHTATKHAPWYVVPADHKWFSRVVVSQVIIEALETLNLSFPEVGAAQRKDLEAARKLLR
ncbi:MAG: polyphosphate kinase 2 family protein [Candidatus Hydrogenedentes bacterium]|nr:polyphosphate kinase 2 family protein [Candidatus Hydrogenedentota bacterium]